MNAKGNSNSSLLSNSIKLNVAKWGEGELVFSQQLHACLFKQAVLSFLRIFKRAKSSLETDKQQWIK